VTQPPGSPLRYELKARTVSELLDGTFKLYRDHFAPLLAIAAIGAVPTLLFTGFVDSFVTAAKAGSAEAAMGPFLGLVLTLPVILIVATVQYCALTSASIDAYLGRPFTVGGALRHALSLFFSLLWAGFLFYLGVTVGFVLLIVPGLYLTLIWAVWLQALVAEDKRGTAALGRSRALTKGATGQLGWLVLVFVLLQTAVVYGFHAAMPSALENIPFLGAAIGEIPSVLIAPVYPALLTLFYFDARIRHEGFDLELKASEGLPASALP